MCYLDISVKSSVSAYCLTFALFFANFSLVLLIKVLLIKKVYLLYEEAMSVRLCVVLLIKKACAYKKILLERISN